MMMDIVAHNQRERKIAENKIGSLLQAYEKLLESAWAADGQIAASDNPSQRALDNARDLFNRAAVARCALINEILGEEPQT